VPCSLSHLWDLMRFHPSVVPQRAPEAVVPWLWTTGADSVAFPQKIPRLSPCARSMAFHILGPVHATDQHHTGAGGEAGWRRERQRDRAERQLPVATRGPAAAAGGGCSDGEGFPEVGRWSAASWWRRPASGCSRRPPRPVASQGIPTWSP